MYTNLKSIVQNISFLSSFENVYYPLKDSKRSF